MRYFGHLSLAMVVLLAVSAGRAQPADAPNAADLVRRVREGESWIDRVESLHLKMERRWQNTPHGIAARKAELQKRLPATELTEETHPDLRAESKDSIEIAFDKTRLVRRQVGIEGKDWRDERIWDGKRVWTHGKSPGQEYYALDKDLGRAIGRNFLQVMTWPRAGVHEFWWEPVEYRTTEGFVGRAEDFRVVGRENFRGVDCWKLECDWYLRTWYVGVKDQRLYGTSSEVIDRDKEKEVNSILLQLAADAHHPVTSIEQYYTWYNALDAAKKHAIDAKYWKAIRPLSRHYQDHWLSDYREVAAGCWMPMSQGYNLNSDDGRQVNTIVTLTITQALANPLLADSMFAIEMQEGIDVHDWGHAPPLHYKYKKHFEPEEWQAILAKANEEARQVEEYERAGDALVGQGAPEFPEAKWINSKPLTLAEVKGKPVILDFFAEWCGPCKNDLPTMAKLHEDAKSNGLLVIGIHAPGSEQKKIDALVKEYELKFPIYIDPPEAGDASWGKLMKAYRIQGIPKSYLIGPDGKIVAHGTLAKVVGDAQKLASGAPAEK